MRNVALLLHLLLSIGLSCYAGWAALKLPTDVPIPVQWNEAANIVGYADLTWARILIFIFPILLGLLTIGFSLIPRYDSRTNLTERFDWIYTGVTTLTMIVLSLIGVDLISSISSASAGLTTQTHLFHWIMLGVSLLLIVFGGLSPRLAPNHSMGIRTPWTLRSDHAWYQTHKIGGYLYFMVGLSGFVLAFSLNMPLAFYIFIGAAIAVTCFVAGLSYLFYNREKTHPH